MLSRIISFLISFLIFSNIVNYYNTIGKLPINNVGLFLIIFLYVFFLTLQKKEFSFIKMPIFYWTSFYLFVIMFWYILPSNDLSTDEFRRKMLTIASYIIFTIFIYYNSTNLKTVKLAIFFTTIMSIFNNIYQFFSPFAFISHFNIETAYGRSFGFYMNPTIAGGAIMIGMLLTLDLLKKEYRIWYILLAFIGVLLTFSRSVIVGFILIYIIITLKKLINFKLTLLIPIVFLIIFNLSLPFFQSYIEKTYENTSSNILNRITWFADPNKHVDKSQYQREYVAKAAIEMFTKNPLLGTGLGTTSHWKHEVSTHNIYLTYLAELGILGFFIYPSLIYSIIKQSTGMIRDQLFVFAFFIFFIGFFSHTVLDQLFSIYAYALAANMSFKSLMKADHNA